MTKYGVILAIMDMAPAKSDVNGSKKKVCFFLRILMKKGQKHQKVGFSPYRPKLY